MAHAAFTWFFLFALHLHIIHYLPTVFGNDGRAASGERCIDVCTCFHVGRGRDGQHEET